MTKETSGQYVTVPVEPTEEMLQAGCKRHWPQEVSHERMAMLFKAMLAAAPHTDTQAAIKEAVAKEREGIMAALIEMGYWAASEYIEEVYARSQ